YFLREAPEAKKHPVWGKILANYFDKLKEVYNSDPRVKGTDASLEDRDKAGQFARDAAYKAAFGDVEFKELDAAVKSFLQTTKHPWPEVLDTGVSEPRRPATRVHSQPGNLSPPRRTADGALGRPG